LLKSKDICLSQVRNRMDFKACSHQCECLTEIQSDFCLWFVCSTSDQCSWTNSWM